MRRGLSSGGDASAARSAPLYSYDALLRMRTRDDPVIGMQVAEAIRATAAMMRTREPGVPLCALGILRPGGTNGTMGSEVEILVDAGAGR
jgi:hypothetical protein